MFHLLCQHFKENFPQPMQGKQPMHGRQGEGGGVLSLKFFCFVPNAWPEPQFMLMCFERNFLRAVSFLGKYFCWSESAVMFINHFSILFYIVFLWVGGRQKKVDYRGSMHIIQLVGGSWTSGPSFFLTQVELTVNCCLYGSPGLIHLCNGF